MKRLHINIMGVKYMKTIKTLSLIVAGLIASGVLTSCGVSTPSSLDINEYIIRQIQ